LAVAARRYASRRHRCDCPRVAENGYRPSTGVKRQGPRWLFDLQTVPRARKRKKGSPTENKRLFLLVPGEYSSPRNIPIERNQKREREAERSRETERANTLALNLHMYSSDTRAYRRGGLTRSRTDETGPRMERVGRGMGNSNHERAPGDIDAVITTRKGAQLVPPANLAGDIIVSLRGAHCLYPP